MEYTIIVNGKSYDLPKKTISVMSALDEVSRVDENKNLDLSQKYDRCHRFMKDILGEESCKEIFGSENLDEIDLSEITLAVNKVIDAYEKPVNDYNQEKNMSKLNGVPFEKIIALSKAADKMNDFPRK